MQTTQVTLPNLHKLDFALSLQGKPNDKLRNHLSAAANRQRKLAQ